MLWVDYMILHIVRILQEDEILIVWLSLLCMNHLIIQLYFSRLRHSFCIQLLKIILYSISWYGLALRVALMVEALFWIHFKIRLLPVLYYFWGGAWESARFVELKAWSTAMAQPVEAATILNAQPFAMLLEINTLWCFLRVYLTCASLDLLL